MPYSRLVQDTVQRSLSKTSSTYLTEADTLENSFQFDLLASPSPSPHKSSSNSFQFDDLLASPSPSPQKSSSKLTKSFSTAATESMTKSSLSDFQGSFVVSTPKPQKFTSPEPRSPRKLCIPGTPDHAWNIISPLPDPSPGYGLMRRKVLDELNQGGEQLADSLRSSARAGCRSSYFVPGITAKGRTVDESVHSKDFVPSTPPIRRRDRKRENDLEMPDFAPLNVTARLIQRPITRTVSTRPSATSPTKKKAPRRRSEPAISETERMKHAERGRPNLEDRPPTPIRRRHKVIARKSSSNLSAMRSSLMNERTPTRSTRTGTSRTGTSSSGSSSARTLSDHFKTGPNSPDRYILPSASEGLPSHTEEVSETGAVIVRTRRVPKNHKSY